MVNFENLPRWVNKKFYPLYWDRRRFIIMIGGAGSGKSVDAHQRAIFKMVAERGHNFLVVRKVASTNAISTWPLMLSIIAQWNLSPLFKINKSAQTITNVVNGNQMKFMGLDDIEKLKSITFERGVLTDILVEEATEITEGDFKQLNLRLRGRSIVPYQITMCFNPISDTHWIKYRFFDNPGPKKEKITLHHSTYLDNRFVDAEYKEELEALKHEDPVYYDIYALGKWGSIGNIIFRNVEYGPCPYSLGDFDAVYAGQDFGFNHYNAIELIGLKDGNKYSFSELYVRHMTNDEIITLNKEKGILSPSQKCVADSAEPKSIKEWEMSGYWMDAAIKGPDSVRQHINWLKRGKWLIDPEKCPGLASEVKTFKWKEDKDGNVLDEPVKFKDDAIAACRYAIEELTEVSVSILDAI